MKNRRAVVEIGQDDLETLLGWSTSSLASVRCAVRANMVLMAAAGFSDSVIARELDVGAPRVRRWVARYAKLGLQGIKKDAPRGGRPRQVSAQRVVELTTQTQPEAATQWSTRTMAKETGASAATISRIWRSHGLKPHLSKTFKVSNDIRFEEKLTDIVGLYMNPPERAVVLCCDEKSQVQALDRTQPGVAAQTRTRSEHDPRLQTPWNDHAVCGAQYSGWQRHLAMPSAPPAHGVAQIPQADRYQHRT